jgi:multisubunit Na+/H+ antiporter MnhG subunit
MSILIAALFLVIGLIGVFRPSFFYKSELLTPQQIERNKRIWNRGGAALIILGLVLLAVTLFVK